MRRFLCTPTILSAAIVSSTCTCTPKAIAWSHITSSSWLMNPSVPMPHCNTIKYMSSSPQHDKATESNFRIGDSVQVEIISFGPLGASVHVVGLGHSPENLIPESDPPLALGLVLQREIHYFRQARDNVDVIRGEVLPAYVEKVRDGNKLDISLRKPGGKAKTDDVSDLILERLEWEPTKSIPVGDKSSPELIGKEFPGTSKSAFKKAVSALYKRGLVQPGPDSIQLMTNKEQEE